MKTIQEVDSATVAVLNSFINRANESIEVLNNYKAQLWLATERVRSLLPQLVKSLGTVALEIKEVRLCKTGSCSQEWANGDTLELSLTCIPIGSKFRFIKFAGYKASGNGINQDRLNEKATKIEEQLKNDTGASAVHVNPFSLEYKGDEPPANKSVLITIKA